MSNHFRIVFLCIPLTTMPLFAMELDNPLKRKAEEQEENRALKRFSAEQSITLIGHNGVRLTVDAQIAQCSPTLQRAMNDGKTEIMVPPLSAVSTPIELPELQLLKLYLEIMYAKQSEIPTSSEVHPMVQISSALVDNLLSHPINITGRMRNIKTAAEFFEVTSLATIIRGIGLSKMLGIPLELGMFEQIALSRDLRASMEHYLNAVPHNRYYTNVRNFYFTNLFRTLPSVSPHVQFDNTTRDAYIAQFNYKTSQHGTLMTRFNNAEATLYINDITTSAVHTTIKIDNTFELTQPHYHWSPDGRFILAHFKGKAFILFDVMTSHYQTLVTQDNHVSNDIREVQFSPNSQYFTIVFQDVRYAYVYDIQNVQQPIILISQENNAINHAVWSYDTQRLYFTLYDMRIVEFDWKNNIQKVCITLSYDDYDYFSSIAHSPHLPLLATTTYSSSRRDCVEIWDTVTGTLLYTLDTGADYPEILEWSSQNILTVQNYNNSILDINLSFLSEIPQFNLQEQLLAQEILTHCAQNPTKPLQLTPLAQKIVNKKLPPILKKSVQHYLSEYNTQVKNGQAST